MWSSLENTTGPKQIGNLIEDEVLRDSGTDSDEGQSHLGAVPVIPLLSLRKKACSTPQSGVSLSTTILHTGDLNPLQSVQRDSGKIHPKQKKTASLKRWQHHQGARIPCWKDQQQNQHQNTTKNKEYLC